MLEPDYGVVIHCWKNPGPDAFDCLVAFLGDEFDTEEPAKDAYFAIYAATSLARIGVDDIADRKGS